MKKIISLPVIFSFCCFAAMPNRADAQTLAKNPDVVRVHLDQAYNRSLGLDPKTFQPNRRPDVLSIYEDTTIKRIEVQSITDVPAVLRSRKSALDQQLIDNVFIPTPPVVVRPH